jgi:hypothetical protein
MNARIIRIRVSYTNTCIINEYAYFPWTWKNYWFCKVPINVNPRGGEYVGHLIDFCSPPLGIWSTPSPESGDIWIDCHFASLGRTCVENWGKQLSRKICVPSVWHRILYRPSLLFFCVVLFVTIHHSASTVNRSSHLPGHVPFWIFLGGTACVYSTCWVTKSAYAKEQWRWTSV